MAARAVPTGEHRRTLDRLTRILMSSVVRGRHTKRLEKHHGTPPWYARRRTRRSISAVLFLHKECTAENLAEIIAQQWITLDQLNAFLRRTRLSEGLRATIERAVRVEQERLDEQERRRLASEYAARTSTGTGMTGELTRIIDGAELPPQDGTPRYRRGQRVRTGA